MPDNNLSDGQPGGDGAANPNTSQVADSPPSIDAEQLFNTLKGYPGFQEFVKSQAQSKHDKRISKIEKTLGLAEQVAQVDELQAQGLPRELAVEWLEWRNSQAQTPPATPETSVVPEGPAGQQAPQGQDDPVEAVAINLGLDPNSQAVLDVRRQGGSEVDQIRNLTAKFAQGQTQTQVNPAATMPTSTGQPANPNLQAQYEAERNAIGFGNANAHIQLKEKYRKLGLDIL